MRVVSFIVSKLEGKYIISPKFRRSLQVGGKRGNGIGSSSKMWNDLVFGDAIDAGYSPSGAP